MHLKSLRINIILTMILLFGFNIFSADYYTYDGRVLFNVKRDRIIAIAEDYASLSYNASSDNVTAQCTGVTVFDTTPGAKIGTKYCWGGETSTKQYLAGLLIPLTIGNRNTSSSSSYGQCAVGEDCSGFVSNAWTSSRQSTSGFPNISDDITYEQLRMGDALNYASSHIRLFDYYISNVGTCMLYESTSGSGILWKNVHRSLARDNNYVPIRYNSTYDVVVYPQPDILYIKRTGTERAELRWDGQADIGFRLYFSLDGANWSIFYDTSKLTYDLRVCEISGLMPDMTYYFKMTSVNAESIETLESDIVIYRLDGGQNHRLLMVDGYDRYADKNSGKMHTLLTLYGKALTSRGIGFDFSANEAVVDEQINLLNYNTVIWMLGDESTFDETFSWAEQMHLMNFMKNGGALFVSGAEIGWDIDSKAESTTYKNGSPNDRPFYNNYLKASFSNDDAETYQVQGEADSIFDGINFNFDDGTNGTYDVQTPDVITPYDNSTVGLTYNGGVGGTACVYNTSPTNGKVVTFGFPFETIYPETARNSVMKSILNYFDITVIPPTIKTVKQTGADSVTITWQGYASKGFRLFQRTDLGAWSQIMDENDLSSDSRSAVINGLSNSSLYEFKLKAINSTGESADSDIMVCALGTSGNKILLVDGYDRYNAQFSWNNHALLGNFADALLSNSQRYDSCSNESVIEGIVNLSDYNIVMWICGQEATESETFGYQEQIKVQDYLKGGGKLFVSGAEIGWDLVNKANTANEYSNGNTNDSLFCNDYLKFNFINDDADTYQVRGASSTVFEGRNFFFDNGTNGTYDVKYPDIISAYGGSVIALYYGSSGTNVAGIIYTGIVNGGASQSKIISFGFPFETIYQASDRTNIMADILTYFGEPEMTPTPTPIITSTPTPAPTMTPTTTPTPIQTPGVSDWSILLY